VARDAVRLDPDDASERLFVRLATACKYWICKRAPASRAQECLGGLGYVSIIRLYRGVESRSEGSVSSTARRSRSRNRRRTVEELAGAIARTSFDAAATRLAGAGDRSVLARWWRQMAVLPGRPLIRYAGFDCDAFCPARFGAAQSHGALTDRSGRRTGPDQLP
jgi:hypothetical protein